MRYLINFTFIFLNFCLVFSQNYDSYFTGNQTDKDTTCKGGVCIMGGASEHDNAIRWFLNQANGGDVLVLRASGSDGYNTYMYTELGVTINSVETIVFNDLSASNESYIHQKIKQAEGIWFAGGDQWNYVSYWKNTPIDSLINEAILTKNIVIGGTSAGMAILGDYYFSAQNGTITSDEALNNPYHLNATIGTDQFITSPLLSNIITDTHFDNPDRKGRLSVFLAKLVKDQQLKPKAIACNEYTAVCIDSFGIASVFGDYPNYDEFAYFVEVNCELESFEPEICESNTPLTWNYDSSALKVIKIAGTNDGSQKFDVLNWNKIIGGDYLNWSINNGIFIENLSIESNCDSINTSNLIEKIHNDFQIFPNPFDNELTFSPTKDVIDKIEIYSIDGIKLSEFINLKTNTGIKSTIVIDLSQLNSGTYFCKIFLNNLNSELVKIVKN
jgi:cyanophycinase-like exopeptidase